MDEELESLLRQLGGSGRRRSLSKVGQDRADIMDRVEDIGALFSLPALWTREAALARGMVTLAVDVVQRSRPTFVDTDLVRPDGNRRKVAGRVGPSLVALLVLSKDGADGLEDVRLEERLSD